MFSQLRKLVESDGDPRQDVKVALVPFVTADVFRIVLLTAFPIISIFLV